MNEIVTRPQSQLVARSARLVVPPLVAAAGEHALRRFLEFFAATISNKNTRAAYYGAVCHFFAWFGQHGIDELVRIELLHVAAYIERLQHAMAKPTVKQHLAASRMFFDRLVVGQVLAANPAHAVRGPKHVVERGKTPVAAEDQARRSSRASTSRPSSVYATALSSAL